jgi:hypothetical protein
MRDTKYMGRFLPPDAFENMDDFILECLTGKLRLQFMVAENGFLLRLPAADAAALPQDQSGPYIGFGECAYSLSPLGEEDVRQHRGCGAWIDADRPALLAEAFGHPVPVADRNLILTADGLARLRKSLETGGPLEIGDFMLQMYMEACRDRVFSGGQTP